MSSTNACFACSVQYIIEVIDFSITSIYIILSSLTTFRKRYFLPCSYFFRSESTFS